MDKELIKSRLMDYLYDELNEADKKEVERWLRNNPEAQEELMALQQTREVLSKLTDVEPVAPIVKISSSHSIRRRWLPMAITAAAAAFLLLLIATNVSIQTHEGGMIIAFGKAPKQSDQTVAPMNPKIVENAIAVNNQLLFEQLDSIQALLQAQLIANQDAMQAQWTRQWSAKQVGYENQIKTLAGAEFKKKYPELAAFIQDMQLSQQQEIRFMLNQLWSNWQQIRAEDLRAIETNLIAIQQNVELNRQGTEELFKNVVFRTNTGD
ncbi:MAG: hypothetical protein SFU99_01325 [Saprospiraceae bacterium]|nr:hypothetical protein [Saprospiraceae bacterium]